MGVEYSHAISLMPGHLQFPLLGHTVGKIKINKCLVWNTGGEGLGFKIFNYITVEINCNLLLFPFYIRVSFCIAKIIFVSHIVTSLIIIILTGFCFSSRSCRVLEFKRSRISPTPPSMCPQTHTPIAICNIL